MRKQIIRKERAVPEDRDADYRGPSYFAKEQGKLNWQTLLKHSLPYVVFCSLQPWKCHIIEEWLSYSVSVYLPGETYKPEDRKRFLL